MSLINGCFKKAYFEITNVCNANCSFCPKNSRPPHFVTDSEFDRVTDQLKGRVEYLYFHLMGEPLLHPRIIDFSKNANHHPENPQNMLTHNLRTSVVVPLPFLREGIDKTRLRVSRNN